MKSYGKDVEEQTELEGSAVGVVDDAFGEGDECDDQGGGESGLLVYNQHTP